MKILEVNSIDFGSSKYVSDMLKTYIEEYFHVDSIDSIKKINKNPIKLYRCVKNLKKYDILHCHLGIAAKFVQRFGNKQVKVATLHGFQKFKHYKRIDYFTAVSKAVRDHFVEQGLNSEKIIVLPNGVSDKFLSIKKRHSEVFTISQVGHLTKNLELSFLSLAKLKQDGFKFRFLVAGTGKKIEDFYPLLRNINIFEDVKFLGFVKNIEDIYSQSDLLIGTSEIEGFHLPVLEGMACGLPVVTTDSLGVRDFFVDGENGFFAEHHPVDFSEKVKKIITNRDLCFSISEKNRHKALNFTWKCVARKYIDYFLNIYEREI